MKGLMIKDFKLMWAQKMFFVLIFLLGIALIVVNKDAGFSGGYLALIFSMFVVSTISYDEYDNGSAFLFSLPVTRKEYVKEKYLLGLLIATVVWVITFVFSIINNIEKVTGDYMKESCLSLMCNMALVCFMLAFMLPIQFKFGTEKGRMVTAGIVGAIMGLAVAGSVYIEKLGSVLGEIVNGFQKIPSSLLIAGILLILGTMIIISYFISVRIMERKEF